MNPASAITVTSLPLRNPQWEMFVREWVELELSCDPKARVKAFERAGYAPSKENARRLSNRIEVRSRFQALFAEALEYRNVRPAAVVTRIDRIARANVVDFYEEDGKTLRNLKALPRELTEALKSVKINDAGKIEIEVWDKNQANFTLLKHMGGFGDESERPAVNVNILAGLSVDDQRALAEALEAIAAGPASADNEVAGERRPE